MVLLLLVLPVSLEDWKGREPELLMSSWLKKSFDRDESREFRIHMLDSEFLFGRMDFCPRGVAYRAINKRSLNVEDCRTKQKGRVPSDEGWTICHPFLCDLEFVNVASKFWSACVAIGTVLPGETTERQQKSLWETTNHQQQRLLGGPAAPAPPARPWNHFLTKTTTTSLSMIPTR